MNSSLRTPVVVAVGCAVLVVVVFVLGLWGEAGDRPGAAAWQERLTGVGGGAELSVSDLDVEGGSCVIDDETPGTAAADPPTVTVGTVCVLAVAPFGGGLSPETTRTGSLRALDPVRAVLQVEGVESAQDLGAGCGVDLVFGRSGGRLVVQCLGTGPCRVQLTPGRECS